jgi:hypothetical protein
MTRSKPGAFRRGRWSKITEDFGSDWVKTWNFPKGKVVDDIDKQARELEQGGVERGRGESKNLCTDSEWEGIVNVRMRSEGSTNV